MAKICIDREKVRHLMEDQELSYVDLANIMGTTTVTLSSNLKDEEETPLKISFINRIAEALGVDPFILLKHDEGEGK